METGYQRGKIQEESMHYEMLKHSGEYPIVGVNTFRNPHGDAAAEAGRAAALDRGGEAEPARPARRLPGPPCRASRRRCCKRLQDDGDRQRQRLRGADRRGAGVLARPDHRGAVRSRRAVPAQHVAARMGPPLRPARPRVRSHRPRPVRRHDAGRHGRRRAPRRSARRRRARLRTRAPLRRDAARPPLGHARPEAPGRRRGRAAPRREAPTRSSRAFAPA